MVIFMENFDLASPNKILTDVSTDWNTFVVSYLDNDAHCIYAYTDNYE